MDTQPPLEDINAIVSRFQAWAGAQTPAQAKHGVRELTYEEAIRLSRPRTPLEKSAATDKPVTPGSSINAKPHPALEVSAAEQDKARKRLSSRPTRKNTGKDPACPASKTQNVTLQAPASFRQILAEEVMPRSIVSRQTLTTERRTMALSLRLSSGEHSQMKARAAEANLSVSGYLRACVFEVEELRAQLRRALVTQEQIRVQASVPMLTLPSFVQFVRQLFRRKTTTLAVRV